MGGVNVFGITVTARTPETVFSNAASCVRASARSLIRGRPLPPTDAATNTPRPTGQRLDAAQSPDLFRQEVSASQTGLWPARTNRPHTGGQQNRRSLPGLERQR